MDTPTKWILGVLALGAVGLVSSSGTEVTQSEIVQPTPAIVPIVQEKQPEPKEVIIPKAARPKVVVPKPAPTPAPVSTFVPMPTPPPTPKAVTQSCHSGYSGCLKPNASDYDCAGGSGNGPYYTGKVRVYGSDPFGLDRDNDGWGCE